MSKHRAESMIPLTPATFHIMLVLAVRPAHGYSIMQEVERLSEGALTLGPGTLYRSIQRMLVDDLIEELDVDRNIASDDERRRTYKLTRLGRQVARAEANRLKLLVDESRRCNLIQSTRRRRANS